MSGLISHTNKNVCAAGGYIRGFLEKYARLAGDDCTVLTTVASPRGLLKNSNGILVSPSGLYIFFNIS